MIPIIIHMDMNSYFASVEQQDHPAWRGKPLGVCEHLGGIIIAASREAKQWGIATATPVWEARKLFPKIILTRTSPERYRYFHKRFVNLVSEYTDGVEVYSIDEVFLDLTAACNIKKPVADKSQEPNGYSSGILKPANWRTDFEYVDPFEEAVRVVKEIKRRMKKEVGDWLTVSAGVAENKLLAKIGSDMQKPDGLVIIQNIKFEIRNSKSETGNSTPSFNTATRRGTVSKDESEKFAAKIFTKEELYDRLELTDIPGIGKRLEKRLNDLGIQTLRDLRDYPESKLVARFGIPGRHIYQMGQLGEHPGLDHFAGTEGRKLAADGDAPGAGEPLVRMDEEIKSMGHMYTLPKEFREKKYFVPVLYKLCEMVAARLRRKRLVGDVLHFFLSDKHYNSFGKSHRLDASIQDGREIFLHCMAIFDDLHVPPGIFKLIGVTVSGLRPETGQQSLFAKDRKQANISPTLDTINAKYGDFTIGRVPAWLARAIIRDSVGFGRVKEI